MAAKRWRKTSPRTEFTPSGSVSAESRRESEKVGHTMPGGGFPINDAADLARAKHDVGRASDPAAARAWINKRAKELGKPGLGEGSSEKTKAARLYGKKKSVIRRAA